MDSTKLITKNTDPCNEIANTKRTKGLLNTVLMVFVPARVFMSEMIRVRVPSGLFI